MTLRVMDQPVDGGGWIATFEDVRNNVAPNTSATAVDRFWT